MFIVLLKFSTNKSQAKEAMEAHNAWIKQGMDDGVFISVGSLLPGLGGGILAINTSLVDLQARVNQDPFVEQDIVSAEIIDYQPVKVDPRLEFLLHDQVIYE
ncbi:hypothetical protein [Teredinibacter sp. KSP-S5-2]|uniref:hypothetical protein n=1 Tax=Teredinibacter sp. KSP-S5-2 TaxID=3034506 RepID=UPI0029342A6A|nr:hypothetical protein [Teredinibacter sp. KSP-S5-2]WNO08678.1 hypothetical protein P5V12_17035 [Teredinibacter sp. KSP-S5-2]